MSNSTDNDFFYDIYDSWYIPWWHSRYFFIGVIFLSALFFAGIIVFFMRWKRQKQKIPYWMALIQELEQLRESLLNKKVAQKDCYFTMTYLLKMYITERYNVYVIDKTDIQLGERLDLPECSLEESENVRKIFLSGLTVKFAHEYATQEAIERDIECAIQFIKRTVRDEMVDKQQ